MKKAVAVRNGGGETKVAELNSFDMEQLSELPHEQVVEIILFNVLTQLAKLTQLLMDKGIRE